jgi:AraC-like DNA-binding protein
VAELIRSQVVPLFLARLAAAGHDVESLMARFALPTEGLAEREMVVPVSTVYELPAVGVELMADPFFGLHVAEWLPRGAYGLLEFVMRSAHDMREAATRLVRYHTLFNDVTVLALEDGPHEAVLVHRLPGHSECVGRHANELIIAMMVRVLRESMQLPSWSPRRVAFAHAAPRDTSPLRAYFGGAALTFEHGHNELAVNAADMDIPLQTADSALLAVLDAQAMRLVAKSQPDRKDPDAFWSRLREHVRVALRNGAPRLDDAARALGLSSRTLQRRLEEGDTSFQTLVEEIRRDLACMYVEDGALGSLEIAFLLGYSDRRAFVRAFKRWTGKTPAEFRRG